MLSITELKRWLSEPLGRTDKLLLILASFDAPVTIKDIIIRGREGGYRVPQSSNPSVALKRTMGLAIRTDKGWEISDKGKARLQSLGVVLAHQPPQAASDLRMQLAKISHADTYVFLEEAISAYEYGLLRSAVVMSWLAAVHVLYVIVLSKKLAAFNTEMKKVNPKWKDATTLDDLTRIKEDEFLDRIAAISIIGKNVKDELKKCLSFRNGCGHPNSMKIGPNMVTAHIESLLLHVFKVFL